MCRVHAGDNAAGCRMPVSSRAVSDSFACSGKRNEESFRCRYYSKVSITRQGLYVVLIICSGRFTNDQR